MLSSRKLVDQVKGLLISSGPDASPRTLRTRNVSVSERERVRAAPLADPQSHLQVVPCSWQRRGPITLASDTKTPLDKGRSIQV